MQRSETQVAPTELGVGNTHTRVYSWEGRVPRSRMRWPRKSWSDKALFFWWTLYTPFHPVVRDAALAARIVEHGGRSDFLIGTLLPEVSLKGFINYLVEQGYGNHFIAWNDDDEILSMRYVEDFRNQYHLRIFKDGEVRGHYEFTPEYRPYHHIKKIGHEDHRDYFLGLLKGWINPA